MSWFNDSKEDKQLISAAQGILAEEIKQTALLTQIRDLLKTQPAKPGPAVSIELIQTLEGKEIKGMVNLTDVQKYTVSIKDELDAKQQPIAAAGPFTFVLSDTTLGTLTPSADGLSCDFAAGSKLGTGFITATDSTNQLQAVSNFTIGPSAPVTLELNESTPVNQ